MNPRALFRFATYLAEANGDAVAAAGEERWRTAIGRAYYAAFTLVRLRLEAIGQRFDPGQVHTQVRQKLRDHCGRLGLSFAVARCAATDLHRLHELRLKADYKAATVTTREMAQALSLAGEIISRLAPGDSHRVD